MLPGVVLAGSVTVVGAALGALIGVGVGGSPRVGAIVGGAVSLVIAVPYGRVVAQCRPYPRTALGARLCLVDATWSALNTWAGSLFHAILRLRHNPVEFERSRGAAVVFLSEQAIPGYATTIGPVLAGCADRLERHERIHVFQARLFGPLYLPLVGLGFVVATLVPYWLLVPRERRRPVANVGDYFTNGVYRHTWHEWWAYRAAPSRPR
jgi:hypothetical protein